jgi:hypothetical protein
VSACTHSRLGNQIQHGYAVQTENLQPPHQFVPWITLNGEHTDDMQKQAEKDLIGLVCKSYKVNSIISIDQDESPFAFRDLIHHLNARKTCELFFFNMKLIKLACFFFILNKKASSVITYIILSYRIHFCIFIRCLLCIMHTSFILSTLLILCVSGGLTIDCPKSSAKWCETKEIAQACGVCECTSLCSLIDFLSGN